MKICEFSKCVLQTVVLVFAVTSGISNAQIAKPLNQNPAIPEPANLAEASGLYLGASDFLYFLKGTRCGYAIKRYVPNFDDVINKELSGLYPLEHAVPHKSMVIDFFF